MLQVTRLDLEDAYSTHVAVIGLELLLAGGRCSVICLSFTAGTRTVMGISTGIEYFVEAHETSKSHFIHYIQPLSVWRTEGNGRPLDDVSALIRTQALNISQ